MEDYIIKIEGVSKNFPGVKALDNIFLKIKRGECHAIIGENGAGKSTLIKIIACAQPPSSGRIIVDNADLTNEDPHVAIEKGVGVVYQEFTVFNNLQVYENIFFGREEVHSLGKLNRHSMIAKTNELLKQLHANFEATDKVGDLSTANKQIVEIAKCLSRNAKIIIMDEPSASLTEREIERMFQLVRNLKEQGVTIIYISHKLNEVLHLSDRVSVFRDGKYIQTLKTRETEEEELIRLMVGRDIEDIYPEKYLQRKEEVLRCENLTSSDVRNCSFSLYKGEILGFGGLVGSGRTELMQLIFGASPKIKGEVYLNGEKTSIKSPMDAIRMRIGYVPEDRKEQGLILAQTIEFNSILPNLQYYVYTPLKIVDDKRASTAVEQISKTLRVRTPSLSQLCRNLSGGNQQKVVIAKWLLHNCEILILDEPTRGIDVGAKQEIYSLIRQLSEEGKSIIVVSSEMQELIGLSHRIIVMSEGEIAGELEGDNITQEEVLTLASKLREEMA